MKEIFDLCEKKSILFPPKEFKKGCEALSLDYTQVSKLFSGKRGHVMGRYILPESKGQIFTVIDVNTGKEYDCISSISLEHYFQKKLSDNEKQYINNLRQEYVGKVSVFDTVFVKKNTTKKFKLKKTKNQNGEYQQELLNSQLQNKVADYLRGRIYKAIKAKKNSKLHKSQDLIGCKVDFLMGYLESKFQTGMTWENYGFEGWHIDHVRPCASFDLSKSEEQKACFHYSNLQPLWKRDNLSKGSKCN